MNSIVKTQHVEVRTLMIVRKVLLICGILSSLLYVGIDILAANQWEGYSYISQSFSELVAIEAPTRSLMVFALAIPYNLLVMAFAVGVWASAGGKRTLRVTAGLLIAYMVGGSCGGARLPHALTWRDDDDTHRHHAHRCHKFRSALHAAVHRVRSRCIRKAVPHLLDRHNPANRPGRRLGRFGRRPDGGTPANAMDGRNGTHQHLFVHAVGADASHPPLACGKGVRLV
jgi:hypothetical protein